MFKIILPKIKLNIEKWKWNKEYRIYVSSLGHIKNEYKQTMPIKINNNGYCMIKTNYGYKSIHRLVLLTFKPIPNAENLTVDHLNHNKRDNCIDNLEWVTQKENSERAIKDLIKIKNIHNNNINNIQYYKIQCESKTFSTIQESIEWVIKKQGIDKNSNINNINKEKIAKNIYKAINNNSLYCGKRWKILY